MGAALRFLMSGRFLQSSFIAERGLPAILLRAQQGTLRLVWLPIGISRNVLESRFDQPDAWVRQHRMPKEAVLLLFAFAQQNDGHAEPDVLSRSAGSHAAMPASLYDPFLDALVR